MTVRDFAQQLFNDGSIFGSPSHQGAFKNRGTRSHDESAGIKVGTVVQVFPGTYTCRIMTDGGCQDATWLSNAPIVHSRPGGDLNMPQVEAVVAYTSLYGVNMIVGYLPMSSPVIPDSSLFLPNDDGRYDPLVRTPTGPGNPEHASDSYKYKNKGVLGFEGHRPKNMMPGDMGFVAGDHGNMVAALSSGECMLFSAPMAQVVTSIADRSVRVCASKHTLITAWGVVKHVGNKAGANLSIRGAARTVGGVTAGKYTIRGDLGKKGDLVNFRVTKASGIELAKVHANSEGHVTTLTQNSTGLTMGNAIKRYRKNVVESIGGTYIQSVEAETTKIWKGKVTQSYSSGLTRTIGGGRILVVMGEDCENVSETRTTIIDKGWSVHTGTGAEGDSADITLDAGNTAGKNGGTITFKTTVKGDIIAEINDGNFIVKTGEGTDTIQLGKENPTNNAVKYDELKAAINALAEKLDDHTHDLSIFKGPGSWTSQAPMTFAKDAISNDVTNMKCGTVLIGD